MAETTKLGYGQAGRIDTAIAEGTLDARDIIITEDTSEFVYIRDDNTKQFIRTRPRLFESEEDAVATLNEETDTYAGQTIGVMDDDGKYQLYIVQNGDDGYEIEAIVKTTSVGLTWQSF